MRCENWNVIELGTISTGTRGYPAGIAENEGGMMFRSGFCGD